MCLWTQYECEKLTVAALDCLDMTGRVCDVSVQPSEKGRRRRDHVIQLYSSYKREHIFGYPCSDVMTPGKK